PECRRRSARDGAWLPPAPAAAAPASAGTAAATRRAALPRPPLSISTPGTVAVAGAVARPAVATARFPPVVRAAMDVAVVIGEHVVRAAPGAIRTAHLGGRAVAAHAIGVAGAVLRAVVEIIGARGPLRRRRAIRRPLPVPATGGVADVDAGAIAAPPPPPAGYVDPGVGKTPTAAGGGAGAARGDRPPAAP